MAMRGLVSYRVVAVGYLVVWALMNYASFQSGGVIGGGCFDLLYSWGYYANWPFVTQQISVATAYLLLGWSIGLNRATPQWIAVTCLFTLLPDVERYVFLRWTCMGVAERFTYGLWVGAHALMCLQHAARWGERPGR